MFFKTLVNFIRLCTYFSFDTIGTNVITYPDVTYSGNGGNVGSYSGMDPDGSYKSSPAYFNIQTELQIEADIVKTYSCNDHFFVLTELPSYTPWSWGTQNSVVKVVWNCNNLYIYGPTTSTYQSASTYATHHLHVYFTPTNVRVTTDINSIDMSLSYTYWMGNTRIWIGCDDDYNLGAQFSNVKITNIS